MFHPWVCQNLPSGLKMFLCVSETSKKPWWLGLNRCWNIDFPTPPCICSTWPSYPVPLLQLWLCQHLPSSICSTWPSYQVPMLHLWVCQHWKCSYVSQQPPKNLVHEALIDAKILTSPLPYVFAQLDPIMRYQCFTCGCANTSQVV